MLDDEVQAALHAALRKPVLQDYRRTVFSGPHCAKLCDMQGVTLNGNTFDLLRTLEGEEGQKGNRAAVIPSSSNIRHVNKIVEIAGYKRIDCQLGICSTRG